jgi:phenylalanyl-tRNA synthetase alpha chain
VIDDINRIADAAAERARAAATLDELRSVDAEVLGKRSEMSAIKQRLGSLDPEERKQVGKAINEARAAIEDAIAARRAVLEAGARTERLEAERLDLTEVVSTRHRCSLHLVTQAMQRLEDVFVGMGFTVAEGPEVESDWYNFEALNFPAGHPARDMYDTLYLEPSPTGERPLLRTHTSPVQIRLMESRQPPIYAVMPGRVARRDTADATHMPVFHQIEGLVVDRGITMGDLAGTIDEFTKAYFGPGFSSRLRPSYFPFTEPSAEFDIRRPDGSWLELGGCGMVHPNVFRAVGYDPEEWTGFAFGFGVDRMTAQRQGVDDLRDLFTNDIRFLRQF